MWVTVLQRSNDLISVLIGPCAMSNIEPRPRALFFSLPSRNKNAQVQAQMDGDWQEDKKCHMYTDKNACATGSCSWRAKWVGWCGACVHPIESTAWDGDARKAYLALDLAIGREKELPEEKRTAAKFVHSNINTLQKVAQRAEDLKDLASPHVKHLRTLEPGATRRKKSTHMLEEIWASWLRFLAVEVGPWTLQGLEVVAQLRQKIEQASSAQASDHDIALITIKLPPVNEGTDAMRSWVDALHSAAGAATKFHEFVGTEHSDVSDERSTFFPVGLRKVRLQKTATGLKAGLKTGLKAGLKTGSSLLQRATKRKRQEEETAAPAA